jgi:hypothetical protein
MTEIRRNKKGNGEQEVRERGARDNAIKGLISLYSHFTYILLIRAVFSWTWLEDFRERELRIAERNCLSVRR